MVELTALLYSRTRNVVCGTNSPTEIRAGSALDPAAAKVLALDTSLLFVASPAQVYSSRSSSHSFWPVSGLIPDAMDYTNYTISSESDRNEIKLPTCTPDGLLLARRPGRTRPFRGRRRLSEKRATPHPTPSVGGALNLLHISKRIPL